MDLQYRQSDQWHDQAKFRHHVLTHPAFVGKGLPPSCDAQAWRAALGSFQSQEKAVTLSAELSLSPDDDGPLFDLKLQPPKLELGHRLIRRFGADRFMEVIMPSPTSRDMPAVVKHDERGPDKIIRWLTGDSCHYFLGRTWIPFFTCEANKKVKDLQSPTKTRHVMQERVFFFASDGNDFRRRRRQGSVPDPSEALTPSIRTKMSRYDLLRWALDIDANSKQPVAKLFSRIKLSE